MMRVSHGTIYQALFVQGRGELRRELARCLRTGRARRRPHGRSPGQLPGMVVISERPAEAQDRAVPGHWEGDLVFGKDAKSAVGTLVERSTRYLLLLHLSDGRESERVDAAMRRAIAKLPAELFRTITWDQGTEITRHAAFTIGTGIGFYFCDPHSPWQRASNENTNGLLRQYLPRGSDLSLLTEDDLDAVAQSLNNRPRKTLDFHETIGTAVRASCAHRLRPPGQFRPPLTRSSNDIPPSGFETDPGHAWARRAPPVPTPDGFPPPARPPHWTVTIPARTLVGDVVATGRAEAAPRTGAVPERDPATGPTTVSRRGEAELGSKVKTDVLVVGGGPAGSTAALRLMERGIGPLVVEREHFPRYHIGEAMTGECGAIVRELGFGHRLPPNSHTIKHGVNVFGSRGNSDWWVPVMQRTEDKELHEVTTYSVRRSEFDKLLLDEVVARGAELLQGRATTPLLSDDGITVRGARVETDDGDSVDVEAEITLDCSGQATFLANRKATGPKYLGSYDKQIALFSQVAGYVRHDGPGRERQPGNTHIFYKRKYHWAWAIPLDGEITSIGIVVPAAYFRETKESKADFILRELRELNPGLAQRVPEPELVEPPHVIPNYSFQVRRFAGPGYICVGDAHRFVDPIFSFGLYIAMKEAGLAAAEVERYLAGQERDTATPFQAHMMHTERAIDRLEDMIDTFWENPLAFSVFVHDRYRQEVLDMFAGRVYDGMPVADRDRALAAFCKLLGRSRSYEPDGLYSVPIGSRFHPERAPLWNSTLDSVETTERWLREESGAG